MSRKLVLGLIVVAAAAVPVSLTVGSVSRGHRIYRYQIHYDHFPDSDRPLADWLTTCPGVTQVVADHDSTWLYLAVHTYKRYPSPDVFAACARFGYRGQGNSRGASVVRPLW
jgi:hypothetical protein